MFGQLGNLGLNGGLSPLPHYLQQAKWYQAANSHRSQDAFTALLNQLAERPLRKPVFWHQMGWTVRGGSPIRGRQGRQSRKGCNTGKEAGRQGGREGEGI